MKALEQFTFEDLKRNQRRLKKKALASEDTPASVFLATLTNRDLLISMAIKSWPYREDVKACFENAHAHFNKSGRDGLIKLIATA
jgi:hypothetical protein